MLRPCQFLINDDDVSFSLCFDDWILSSPLIVFLFDCFKISDRFYESMKTDLSRLRREFYTPEPISLTGNYYPRYSHSHIVSSIQPLHCRLIHCLLSRYRITGSMETGSCHVSYLARPYYFYDVLSRYGYSK